MTKLLYAVGIAVIFFLFGVEAGADPGLLPDRRRAQFQNEPGHVLVPFLFNLPGIGSGYGFLGAATNVGGSYTDVSGTLFGGDVNGQAVGIDSIHLIPKRLILDIGGAHLSRVSVQSYSQRGMAADQNDYSVAVFGDAVIGGGRLAATFMERRFEIYLGDYGVSSRLKSLSDRRGETIINAEDGPKARANTTVLGTLFDLTDDSFDPRRGGRLDLSLWRTLPQGSGPDFYWVDYSATAYIPLGSRSTWAFNYFGSDAHVLKEGETDPGAVEQDLGLDCGSVTDPEEQTQCRQFVDSTVAENKFGTATALGGLSRLRSYSEGRYRGAHARFLGTELRWNLTDEYKPFNIYIMKDIRTAVQIALFYEIGTVADRASDLGETTRSSYGAGMRLVTASGVVYRLDLATGQEGFEPSIFFQYPWELL
ncbi:MAG: BamA/TamA family outer membrane protein [Nitrospirae bacterium]|nr:BamA/TamA family outer membrane protein [Nitrospirota bacterium]